MPKKNTGPRIKWRKDRECWEVGEYQKRKWVRLKSGLGSRQAAEGWLAEYLVTQGRAIGPSDPNHRMIGDVLADYIIDKGAQIQNQHALEKCVRDLAGFWGALAVSAINENTCKAYGRYRDDLFAAWQKSMNKPEITDIKNSTVRRELVTLTAALNHDYKSGRLTAVPHVWKPKSAGYKERFFTRQEVARLVGSIYRDRLSSTRWQLYLFVMIGLYTGARKGAILKLKWSQVKLDLNYIDFKPHGTPDHNKKYPKIPIHRKLKTVLRLAKRRGTDLGYVIHINQKRIKDNNRAFASACKRASIECASPYTLRHTAASWMVQSGVPTYKVAAYIGNSEEMIQKHYGHLAPDHMHDVLEALN